MYKETIICIFIIILIIILDIFTQNYTKKSSNEIIECLSELKIEIENDNLKKAQEKIEELDKKWDNKHDKLAYYIEHDELEKVTTELTKLKADVETENYEFAIENLDNCIFILEHIKDKSALKIVNIF